MRGVHVRARPWISVAILLILTEAVYLRPAMFLDGASLIGSDYLQLHMGRIAFAQDALFGERHALPAWYPRELLGAPFVANLQSFPWIPTRLVLLFFDPLAAYAVGVSMASALAALFTYLYCRRAGLSEIGAAAAGWTFACSGFFASRVMAGHLPLLEAYPALPLLLWLAGRAVAQDRRQYEIRDLATLAFASACIGVAGHPQLPVYSLLAATLYAVFSGRGWRRIKVVAAMALGVGATLVVWWPMLLLLGRSTRVLHLAPPGNDIVMPYRRLAALMLPGVDGWPEMLGLEHQKPFQGYPNTAYFWDTASYIGLLPLLSILILSIRSLAKRRWPAWPWAFLAVIGAGAFMFSLRLTSPLRELIPEILLRSPARLLYLSTFSASVALGFGVHELLNRNAPKLRLRQGIVVLVLIAHTLDLGGFARLFVTTTRWPAPGDGSRWTQEIHEARIAAHTSLAEWYRDRFDDVGIFDSILLANPYRAVLGLAGAPPDLNVQDLDGSRLPIPALQGAGVRYVITPLERGDLALVSGSGGVYVYRVPDPWPRFAFFSNGQTNFAPRQALLDRFLSEPRRDKLLLADEARKDVPRPASMALGPNNSGQTRTTYSRPSSDEIRLETDGGQAGFVHVLESHDPGWSAQVDGASAPVVLANGFSMAVPVSSGRHSIQLRYRTPGRRLGWVLSLLSASLLALLLWTVRRPRLAVV